MNQILKRLQALIILLTVCFAIFAGCAPRQIIDLDSVPDYSGSPYVEINGNDPFFESDEITDDAFESYSKLDALGRCGTAFACIGIELMPTEEREDLNSVTPSGWEFNGVSNNREYPGIDGSYLYNRCHLIGFQLAGENANEKNLITGTRYMNVDGMLPFENRVANYVEDTQNHVMYRATPIYKGLDLVASGVLIEAFSVEDDGRGICFCVYVYNVQPGVTINYFTGQNAPNGEAFPDGDTAEGDEGDEGGTKTVYILNTSSKKFHYPDKACSNTISEKNRREYEGTREDLISEGYQPCGTCKP